MINRKPEGKKKTRSEPGNMGYIPPGAKEVSEWANGTIEGNGIWKSEGVARRFKTAKDIYKQLFVSTG
jgi:hypothetical protein